MPSNPYDEAGGDWLPDSQQNFSIPSPSSPMVLDTDKELYAKEVTNNPVTDSGGGLSSFFSFLGAAAGQVGKSALSNYLAEKDVKSQARRQAILNDNHELNPSTGPNDPNAALIAANRTFLEKYLPSSMLYSQDPVTKTTKFSPVYYVIILFLVLGLVWIIRRMFAK